MKALIAGMVGAAALAFGVSAQAQQQNLDAVQIRATELAPGAFMLEGAGGNVTVVAGKGGVIMVDGQFAAMHEKLAAAVPALTGEPMKYLINTH